MFNLYYINYAKAFEIAMKINNKLLQTQVATKEKQIDGDGSISGGTGSFLEKVLPHLQVNAGLSGSKSDRAVDTLRVVSTKSTILNPVLQKSVEIRKLSENRIGKLLTIRDVNLKIVNYEDTMGSKMLLGGMFKHVPIEGVGSVDLTSMMDTVLGDAAYIVSGEIPNKVTVNEQCKDVTNKLLFKIPVGVGNELENQYSISDLEIGPITILGIYRGLFKFNDIRTKVDSIAKLNDTNENIASVQDVETDDKEDVDNSDSPYLGSEEMIHYIDVIALLQELS